MNLNEKILLALHRFATRSKAIRFLALFFSRYFIFLTVGGFIFALYYIRADKFNWFMVEFIVATLSAIGASYVVGYFYKMQRPCERKDVKSLFVPLNHWKSFPSDHTLVVFVCAGTAALAGIPVISLVLIVCGLLVGISRVIAGVHYPADILGGAMLGWFVAVIVGMFGQWI